MSDNESHNSDHVEEELQGYNFVKTLGKGNFGKVKLGVHVLTGEYVAIKILEKDLIFEKSDIERIAREIKIMKMIRHTNIIQLYEIIEKPKRLYLIMEYAEGGDLFDLIVKAEKVKEQPALNYFAQILLGLEYLHSRGVAHRDMKPENILISKGKIKIADFGLGNMFEKGQMLKTACGSPCYASPEMLQRVPYNPQKIDIWSSGIILYAMVCGYLPFEDEITTKLYQKIKTANTRYPKFLSDNLKSILKRILDKNPETRASIQEMQEHPALKLQFQKQIRGEFQVNTKKIKNICEIYEITEEDKLISYLKKNKHNNLTTIYYLAAREKDEETAMLAHQSRNDDAPRSPSQQGHEHSPKNPESQSVGSPGQTQTVNSYMVETPPKQRMANVFPNQESGQLEIALPNTQSYIEPRQNSLLSSNSQAKAIQILLANPSREDAIKIQQQEFSSILNDQVGQSQNSIKDISFSRLDFSNEAQPEQTIPRDIQSQQKSDKSPVAVEKQKSIGSIKKQLPDADHQASDKSVVHSIQTDPLNNQVENEKTNNKVEQSSPQISQKKQAQPQQKTQQTNLQKQLPPRIDEDRIQTNYESESPQPKPRPLVNKQFIGKSTDKEAKKLEISQPVVDTQSSPQISTPKNIHEAKKGGKVVSKKNSISINISIDQHKQKKDKGFDRSFKGIKTPKSGNFSMTIKEKQISRERDMEEKHGFGKKVDKKVVATQSRVVEPKRQQQQEIQKHAQKQSQSEFLLKQTLKKQVAPVQRLPLPLSSTPRVAPTLNQRSHSRDKPFSTKKIVGKQVSNQPFLIDVNKLVLCSWTTLSAILVEKGAEGRVEYFSYGKSCIYVVRSSLRGLRSLKEVVEKINSGDIS